MQHRVESNRLHSSTACDLLVIGLLLCLTGCESVETTEPAASTIENGRIFYLSFDESFDATEAGGDRTPEVRGQPRLVEGKQGQAASFTDDANIIFDAEGNFDQSEGAVAMWILPYWPNDDGVPHCFLEVPVEPERFTDGGFVISKGWSSGIQPNHSYFYNSPGHYHISGGGKFEPNEWMHVMFTWSTATRTLHLYLNGQRTQTEKYEQIKPRPAIAGRLMVVGARLGGKSVPNADLDDYFGHLPRDYAEMGGDGAEAAIDELMIFNRMLTAEEAAYLAGVEPKPTAVAALLDSPHANEINPILETPHERFARPLATEPVKALFIAPLETSNACRDVVELFQRFDMQYTAVTTRTTGEFAYKQPWFRARRGLSPAEKTQETLDRLAEDPEVIVVPNFIFSHLPALVQNEIMSRVRNGAGLVVTAPRELPAAYEAEPFDEGLDEVVTGVPLAGMPEFFTDDPKLQAERANGKVRAYKVGTGRVVVIDWRQEGDHSRGSLHGLAPVAADGRWTRQFGHRYNYHMSLAAKAMLWAAGRELRARWIDLPPDGQIFKHSELGLDDMKVRVQWDGANGQPASLAAAVRDPLGRIVSLKFHDGTLKTGVNAIPLPALHANHGLHFLELTLRTSAGVENWATVAFYVRGPENIISLTTESEYCERGQAVRGTVEFEDAITQPAQLVLRARDTNGRIYNRVTVPVEAGVAKTAFEIPVDRPTTLASYIEAELVRDGEALSFADAIVFVPKRNFPGFLSVLWSHIPNAGIGQVALRQMRKAGFNTIYHWGNSIGDFHNDAMADLMPTQYCTRLAIRPDARGWADQAPGHGRLDPEFRAFIKRFSKTVQASMPLGPPYYSLGDENHCQFGVGYSPYELQAFKQFLEKRYGTIERLNEEYGSQYATFEEVPRYKEAEAIEEGNIAALIDHRLGTDDEWANYHRDLVEAVRKLDPNARVGAEGSQSGDMERMLDVVQLWSPYGDHVLLRSLATKDHVTSHWWGGYAEGAADCTKLWRWLIRGFANYNQMFCAMHVDGALFNADYSYRAFFENLLIDLRELYAGTALLLRDADVVSEDAIAVYWSRESEHASYALKNLATMQSSQTSLVKTLALLNRDYRYISSRRVARDELLNPRAKILFVPTAHALTQEAADGIVEFVREGGTVVADFLPSLNEFGRRLENGRLDELFGATCGGKTSPKRINDLRIDVTINGQPVRVTCPRTVGHADVTVTDAQVLASDENGPLMLVKKVGNGRAILLNFDASRCSRDQRTGLVEALLKAAEADPQYRLTAPPETQLSAKCRGNLTLLGVILPEEGAGPTTVSWDEAAHVYNVRTGEHLGRISEIAIPITDDLQRVHLYALQRSSIATVVVETADQAKTGETLTVNVGVGFGDPALAPSDRLVRIDVTNPQGEHVMHYRSFARLNGPNGTSEIPFAFNDSPGEWTITATDVATSVSASTTVTLSDDE